MNTDLNKYLISLLFLSCFISSNLKEINEDIIDISSGYTHPSPTDRSYTYVAILTSNDLHGHFYPEDISISNNDYTRGGFDYLAKYIEIMQEEYQNRFIYFDAGDLFKGGLESDISNGEIMTEALNLMQCQATTFGLHEFDYSRQFLEDKISKSNFPYLSTNIYDNKKKTKNAFGANHLTSKVFTLNVTNTYKEEVQLKIGVVGLAKNLEKNDIKGEGYDDITFIPYRSALTEEAIRLRQEENCNAVLLLANVGIDCGDVKTMNLNIYNSASTQDLCSDENELYQLLSSLDAGTFDAVITGQSHKQVHHWVYGIPIVSNKDKGLYTSILYLAFTWSKSKQRFDISKNKVAIEGPIPICEKIFNKTRNCEIIKPSISDQYFPTLEYQFHGTKMEKSTNLTSIHDKYDNSWKPLQEKICEITGTDEILTLENNGDFYLGNILSEIQSRITGSGISVFNTKLLSDTWNPGQLPKYKINTLINFKSNLCTFTMNGNELIKMMSLLQNGEDKYYCTNGLKQIMSKDENNKYYLSHLKYFDGFKEEEIIPDKDYTVSAIEELIVKGKSDFRDVLSWYTPKNLKCDYGDFADIVENYLKAVKTLDVGKFKDVNNPKIKFIL